MRFFHSFYARLSLLFLVMVLLLGGASLVIAYDASRHLFDEVEQLLNREYAASIAQELQPLVAEGFSEEKIYGAIHYMMVLNPMVEIYLLDQEGKVIAYFTHPHEELLQSVIPLEPIRDFLNSDGYSLVLGCDPRTLDGKKPFSAALLPMGEESAYVYVILRGERYDRSLSQLQSNYYLQSGLITFIIALIATVGVGLVFFFLLTLRLKRLSQGVRAFQQGDYSHRVEIGGRDELGILGNGFNEMARSIEEGIEKIHRAEEQRGELIANISHDLRSPLTSIRGYLETLQIKGDRLSEEERKEFLGISLKNISNFQNLVEELFELAKLEARQIEPQLETFSLAELAQDVVFKVTPMAQKGEVTIDFRPPVDRATLEGDIPMLERVLTNVLENGLAHTPARGVVTMVLSREEGNQIITISDTGPGIEAKDLPHIFERFYRADKSRNRETPGTGLGLAIAKEVVELHRGTIRAESPEGGGAVFRISLPLGTTPF
ncbi:MAG: HAMP domain-containing sensor histidine kinase [Spirochaetales bacterium]|nr:HAMP domain-containing sensor histidine kinase [Spirochaetales bacterium]